jgi:hypothetical protein
LKSNDDQEDFQLVEPSASPILESMRAFGYTPETAIADLIDNSISAGANAIEVDFHWTAASSWVSIADDGKGMSEIELVEAMRLGSTSPLSERAPKDLGRFGLGLKTASFSQGRELTVVTRGLGADTPAVARRWDLDRVLRTNRWELLKSAPNDISTQMESLLPVTGTVVAWTKLDRLLGSVYGSDSDPSLDHFLRVVEAVSSHLSMVFHRFLSRKPGLKISVNGMALVAWNPFLSSHPATWSQPAEALPIAGENVTVRIFVLPHKSKLTDSEHAAAGGTRGWNASQGFYVYRADRLLVAGSWLGIGGTKDEHSKLARISLDLPTSLDHLWQVDVRKESIKPPGSMLGELRRIARLAKQRAQEVYRFRGKELVSRTTKEFVVAWTSRRDRDGALHFRLNRAHPFIEEARQGGLQSQNDVERLLRFVEETIPTAQIGISLADALDVPSNPFGEDENEIAMELAYIYERLRNRGRSILEAIDYLSIAEPFSLYPAVVQAFREQAK